MTVFLLVFSFSALSQEDGIDVTFHQGAETPPSPTPKQEREFLKSISVGGNLGLIFGTYSAVSVKPEAAYHFLQDWMAAGIGATYTFVHDNFYNISDHSFGGKIFAEGHLFNYVGLRIEYETVNYKLYSGSLTKYSRQWANMIGAGGGLHYKTGRWVCYLLLIYDFSDTPQYTGLSYTAGIRVFLKK
jgi:hypothetical protein